MQDIELAALISSRLCHDLVGPTSAVVNGLELIESEPELAGEALKMVASSAEQMSRRLQFYRGAYGVAAGLTFRAAHELARGFFAEGRVAVTWRTDAATLDASLPVGSAKLALNLMLLGADLLGRGGGLTVEGRGSPRPSLIVEASGESLRDDLGDGSANHADLNPRTVQPHFVARLAEALGGRVTDRRRGPGAAVLTVDF